MLSLLFVVRVTVTTSVFNQDLTLDHVLWRYKFYLHSFLDPCHLATFTVNITTR
jgi:hypothetical protein